MKTGNDAIRAIYIGEQFPEYFLSGCEIRDDLSTSKEVYQIKFDSETKWRDCIGPEEWIRDDGPVPTLTLVLKGDWYDLMITGEKNREFRKPTQWIKSRLIDKEGKSRNYTFVKFIHGYKRNAPYFLCEYEGFGTGYSNTYKFKSRPDLEVVVHPEDYVLFLGKVVYKYEPLKIEV
jgi:hypothetical protein